MKDYSQNLSIETASNIANWKRRDFGPFLFNTLNIWLFLSIVLRFQGVTSAHVMMRPVFTMFAWACLYFSFRVSATKFINRTGGAIQSKNFASASAQWKECKIILYFILTAALLAVPAFIVFGKKSLEASALLFAFDGIAYDHHSVEASMSAAFASAFVFLCFLQHAEGILANGRKVVREIWRHLRYLLPAMLVLILAYEVLSLFQGLVRAFFSNWLLANGPDYAGPFYLIYMYIFSSVRLLLSVTIIGFGLR